ncbi:DUF2339 domain-containing protein [Neorhizobium lilium]|uniref:DUF2339 domain-containing protein n=1 Tax=Neorhizobium lilium TaxID=2503024 RepID=A0A444LDL8_9HYPH|nr:DUF2339 domain-containing protein [Neorhizobium lilium]RWX75932.1 DUF2339 domain-containing protein [Neorhizobium lilium]
MIELLLLLLVALMIGLNRKTAARLSTLEQEVEALRTSLAREPAPSPSIASVAETAVSEAEIPAIELAAREGVTEVSTSEAAKAAPEDIGTGEETTAPVAAPQPATPVTAPAPASALTRENLESYLGARWPVWVGGVALALGGIFLVRYSIEAGLLGPGARLILATLFGLVLIGIGEFVRRRGMPAIAERHSNAMIPGALTAAGAVTLLGAIYAAHGVYGFIGPAPAFLLLGLVSFGTIGLSLLHGQALAGLGLLASLVTPALVSTDTPNATSLFAFLSLTWLAVNAAARIRRWSLVPTLGNIGMGLWALAYLAFEEGADLVPVTGGVLVMVAGTAFLWPGAAYSASRTAKSGWRGLLRRRPLSIMLSASIMALLTALTMEVIGTPAGISPLFAAAAIIAAVAALGAARAYAFWPAAFSAASAVLSVLLIAFVWLDFMPPTPIAGQLAPVKSFTVEIGISLLLGAVFTLLGFFFLRRFRRSEPEFAMVWSVLMSAVPVAIATISFLNFGRLSADFTHGLYGLILGAVLLVMADGLFRNREDADTDRPDWPANLLVAGSFAGFTLCLHALTNGMVTTILVSVLGFAYLLAQRLRAWPALPWMMAAAMLVVFSRIAWQPTLVGADSLGTTPFFNALLPGYGIPAALAIVSAYLLRTSSDFRVRNIMQALASLSALLTVAVLVRHAMNHGVLDASVPTLGEQSIYTLLTVGFSGILMTLDLKSPSPVFRWGSMLAGVLATINVLSLHVFGLNPFFTGEDTGPWPVVNLLLLGYLLPAIAYGIVAFYARERRPQPYVAMLAIAGAVLGFLWATLSVRRFWQGTNIADWKGFLSAETYSYSVVWLLIGVGLLVLGSRLHARSLRLASGALVMVTVAKVFLIDMSNLEGILRALSFIGLGAVLIGIGLFYQRILAGNPQPETPEPVPAPPSSPPGDPSP